MADVAETLVTEMKSWRRHLHENPEFGFEERETARFVAETLRRSGLTDIAEGIGGTGVVASLKLGSSKRSIALRADMDALRITEATNLPHASRKAGLMHACGHDGHTTMLLGAAHHLAQHGGFDGTVRFVFQPAEEWGKGMQAMLDDGLLARFPFDEIYGLHNKPGLAIGHFETTPGPFYAAEDNFEIIIEGSGGHASAPHRCRDAIVAGAAIVTEMQSIVSRNIDPAELAVVSVTEFHSDGTRNAIAGTARIEGDCRSFSPAVSEAIETAMRRIASGIAKAHGCEVHSQLHAGLRAADQRCRRHRTRRRRRRRPCSAATMSTQRRTASAGRRISPRRCNMCPAISPISAMATVLSVTARIMISTMTG